MPGVHRTDRILGRTGARSIVRGHHEPRCTRIRTASFYLVEWNAREMVDRFNGAVRSLVVALLCTTPYIKSTFSQTERRNSLFVREIQGISLPGRHLRWQTCKILTRAFNQLDKNSLRKITGNFFDRTGNFQSRSGKATIHKRSRLNSPVPQTSRKTELR